VPRRMEPIKEALEVARRGMLDSKASTAVRIRFLDRFCVLNKIYSVSFDDKDSDNGGIKPEDIVIPSLERVKETLAEHASKQKQPEVETSPEIEAMDKAIVQMARPPAASEQKPMYAGYNDLQLMRGEHLLGPKVDDWK